MGAIKDKFVDSSPVLPPSIDPRLNTGLPNHRLITSMDHREPIDSEGLSKYPNNVEMELNKAVGTMAQFLAYA